MKFIIPVESISANKGGIILYDPINNKILKQYVHNKKWRRSGWRGGILYNDYLIATDWTELHYFNIKKWKYEKSYTKSTFNDLHYLKIHDNKLYVVNTGIDAIEIFNDPMNPKFDFIYFLFKQNPKIFENRKLDLNLDYNKMYKVKPHHCHPNCISFVGDKILVTCFDKKSKRGTGEIIDLKTGDRMTSKNHSCHDGNLYKGDFYLSQTRESKILIFKDILNKKFPLKVDEKINIGKKAWWRGMVIKDDIMYVFSSYGYKEIQPCKIAVINLKTKKIKIQRLPVTDVKWDTVYQPQLLEN
jgi:hypothetical protein